MFILSFIFYCLYLVILSWVCDDPIDAFNRKNLVGPEGLLDSFHDRVRDENVILEDIRQYFTVAGYRLLYQRVKALRQKSGYCCQSCRKSIDEVRSVGCSGCLAWFHYHCQSIRVDPCREDWFRKECCMEAV